MPRKKKIEAVDANTEATEQQAPVEPVEQAPTEVVPETPFVEASTDGAPEPKPDRRRRSSRESRNGVTRPNSETMIGKLWAIADSISYEKGRPAFNDEVVPAYMEHAGAVKATANTQYSRWKRYHGVNEMIRVTKEELRQKAEDEKAEQRKREKEAKAAAKVQPEQEQTAA